MKIIQCEQGSIQWLALRAGIPTSSEFDAIITPGGKASKSAERYMYRLLAERLMGHPTIEAVSFWMQRGSQFEADAVSYYELQTECDTTPVGFITNDAGTIGASPDRLVGEDGLLEVKCPSDAIQMMYLLGSGSAYEAYRVQCQGQLWVSGRQWVDVLSYHPELPYGLARIERDPDFIAVMSSLVDNFSSELEALYTRIEAQGVIRVRKQREKSMVDVLKESLIAINQGKVE